MRPDEEIPVHVRSLRAQPQGVPPFGVHAADRPPDPSLDHLGHEEEMIFARRRIRDDEIGDPAVGDHVRPLARARGFFATTSCSA